MHNTRGETGVKYLATACFQKTLCKWYACLLFFCFYHQFAYILVHIYTQMNIERDIALNVINKTYTVCVA